ncbi:hypothetical protein METBIDRAFT_31906 [Metschnikowia bicuspidata var. bicuspidata NRRL YB-4993]|uniref:Uncharacterized protein n=1 Tax=Metschnikowia bicuspidata var. bicuspidata NRRL YB-4993 TaxID=869754 RepID=A0A1A0HBI4_9ASCO|nr:hypothetical protein METBIDRAFT_31906 [Metschnikowia bicuspidata var. bicuspidata NRRL YB-4993]OBA21371.1 hypothetical protein METBIDRAFT_31906 [Metschnikowia bicuspidata var. bicuspidata NRRL YB-4993]
MQHGHGTAFLEVPELGLRMGQHSVHALQMDVEEILWCYQALLQNTAHGKHTHMLIRVSKGMDLGHQYELVRTLAKAGRGMDALEAAMRKRRGGRLAAGPGPKKSRVGNEQTPPGTGIR